MNGTHLSGISMNSDAVLTTGSSCLAIALGRRRILVILTKPAESIDSRFDPLEWMKAANTPMIAYVSAILANDLFLQH